MLFEEIEEVGLSWEESRKHGFASGQSARGERWDPMPTEPGPDRRVQRGARHGQRHQPMVPALALRTGRKTSGPTPFGVDPLRESASMAAITPADYIPWRLKLLSLLTSPI